MTRPPAETPRSQLRPFPSGLALLLFVGLIMGLSAAFYGSLALTGSPALAIVALALTFLAVAMVLRFRRATRAAQNR